jgi:hypothetical protein
MKLKLRKVVILRNKEFDLLICIIGEIYELKAELNSDKRDRKKEAVKKVIHHSEKKSFFFMKIFIG